MGLQPKIRKDFFLKDCVRCGSTFGPESYIKLQNIFYPDGYLPFCNDCVDKYLYEVEDEQWSRVDKLCQMIDIPFIPFRWVEIYEMNPIGAFGRYAEVFRESKYKGLGWSDYYKKYKDLKEQNRLDDELPIIKEEKRKMMIARWGANYDDEALDYLERLYNGLLNTQNINGDLQIDQALKVCKISYEIDCCIREGKDFDKLLSSYDKILKEGNFTPKNVKNVNDFDTFGEVALWLEKNGWKNKYYDDVTRDIVDESMKSIEAFNQRLYLNESGIGESITDRIENLKFAEQKSSNDFEDDDLKYLNNSYDIEDYDTHTYNELIKGEKFEVDEDEDDDDEE